MGDVDNLENLDEMTSYLTPREENEMTSNYQNTTSIACPICEDPFDYLVVCKRDDASLSLETVMSLCVATTNDGRPLLFTHE